ncbi:MAG: DUF805 domain-containing protein [Devosia sp.]
MSEDVAIEKPVKQRRIGRRRFWLWLILISIAGAVLHYVFTNIVVRLDLLNQVDVPGTLPYGPWSIALPPAGKIALLAAIPTFVLLALPNMAIDIRRRHDRGGSGFIAVVFTLLIVAGMVCLWVPAVPRAALGWSFVGIAVIGALLLLNLGLFPGKRGANKYGPDRHGLVAKAEEPAPVAQPVAAPVVASSVTGSLAPAEREAKPRRARDAALEDRLPRSRFMGYFVGTLLLAAVLGGVGYFALSPAFKAGAIAPGTPPMMVIAVLGGILAILAIGFLVDLAIRRRHDRGAAGHDVPVVIVAMGAVVAVMVLGLVPPDYAIAAQGALGVLGVYLAVVLLILPGTRGPNRYGPQPAPLYAH